MEHDAHPALRLPSNAPAMWFRTDGAVRSKSNYRRYERKGRSWNAYRLFEFVCTQLARQSLPAGWDIGEKSRPLSRRPTVVCAIYADTTLDAGNVPKSVLDACEGVVYHNDASVQCVIVTTRRVKEGAAWVAFAIHDGPPTTAHLLASELMSALVAMIDHNDASAA